MERGLIRVLIIKPCEVNDFTALARNSLFEVLAEKLDRGLIQHLIPAFREYWHHFHGLLLFCYAHIMPNNCYENMKPG